MATKNKNVVGAWLQNARYVSIVQSAMPAILAVVLAVKTPNFSWWLAVLAVVGVVAAHLAMNLLDDYFDYKADMLEDRVNAVRKGFKAYTAKYPYLKDGSATLDDLRLAIVVFLGVAIVCGLPIFILRGWTVLAIATLAGILGYFYSAPPVKFCYWGMGELIIGAIFGPLLVMGVYIAAAGELAPEAVMVSIPVGLLVVNILFTHSFIDKAGDEASDKMTLAGLMAKIFGKNADTANLCVSAILNFSPFLVFVVGACLGWLHWAYLAVFIILPRPLWLFWSLIKFTKNEDITADLEKPKKFLGNLGNWAEYRKAGLDWFLIRWFTARNTLSGYCLLIIVIRIILIITHVK